MKRGGVSPIDSVTNKSQIEAAQAGASGSELPKGGVPSLPQGSGEALLRFVSARLPRGEDARDLAQEAYLRLLRRNKIEVVRHPQAYLFRIVTNLIYEHWLKRKFERDSHCDSEELEAVGGEQESSEAIAARHQRIDALTRILNVLPPMQQKVVLMHRRDGMTYAEIALELNTSPDMVKKYLAKGLARCREQLSRYADE